MIILVLVVFISLLLTIFISNKCKDIMNPISMFCVPIIIQIVLYLLLYSSKHHISDLACIVYALGILAFIVGCGLFALTIPTQSTSKNTISRPIEISVNVEKIITLLGIISIIFSLKYIYELGFINRVGENFIRSVRINSIFYYEGGWFDYGLCFFGPLTQIWFYNSAKGDKRSHKWPFIIWGLVSFMMSMSKGELISVILFYIYLYKTKLRDSIQMYSKTKRRMLLIILISIIAFIIVITKLNGLNEETLFGYLVNQLLWFDQTGISHGSMGNGYYVFGFFGRIMKKFGKEFITMNDVFLNSYGYVGTFAEKLYFDGGLLAVIIVMLINGIFTGYVYKKNIKYGGMWTILYLTCMVPCLMSFFDYTFMMTSQVYCIIALWLLKKNKRYIHLNKKLNL